MNDHLNRMIECGVVAVIRAPSSEMLTHAAKALVAGGVTVMEVTMTTPNALRVIEDVRNEMGDAILMGAGTVLDPETARMCILAGAEFIVSPTLNLETIKMCKRYSKIVVPGAYSPTEILTAWEAGADAVKVFPATGLGPGYFKDLKGPLPQIRLTPTGGVSLETVQDFVRAGAEFVAVGGNLVSKKALAEHDWQWITDTAKEFRRLVTEARAE